VIPLALGDVARLCSGRLRSAPEAAEITGVQIDSRRIRAGDLFVAVGRGAAFADDALARGAAAALVPDDSHQALGALGGEVRARSRARVVGITGSTGKTSTKDVLAAICAQHRTTVAAEASFNNELGVPLTLCRLEPDTEICILELAMRGTGQIAQLCSFARPEIGIVTNVGPAHLELVGSIEDVVRAKSELIEALPSTGAAVVPEGFPVDRTDIQVIRFGEPHARVVDGRTMLRFEDRDVELGFAARYQARNAFAALHAARALGIPIGHGPIDVAFSPWRGEETDLPGGGLLVNDAYNANPISMRAALEDLADRADGRRTVAVLGDMAELGPEGPRYHREIGDLIRELAIDAVFAAGPLSEAYVGTASFVWWSGERDLDALLDAMRAELRPGDCVLVKGSRAAGLEIVAERLAATRV
jgi:UDP-N-acetylmuramoyl-tripeptide--D-alanyl-D-alanine ligase